MTGDRGKNRRKLWRRAAATVDFAAAADPAVVSDIAFLRDIMHALVRADNASEAMQFALDRTCPAVGATLGSVFVVDGATELMRLVAAHEWPERWRPWLGDMRVRVGFGPSGEAVSERRMIEVPDVFADDGLEDWQEVAGELGFRALVSVPLTAVTGVVGACTFYFAEPGFRTERVRSLIRAGSDVMAAMVQQESLRERLRYAEAALESMSQRPVEPERMADTEQTLE